MNSQPNPESFSWPFGSQNRLTLLLGDGDVGVHAAAVHADHRLGQEARRVAHVVGDLAA